MKKSVLTMLGTTCFAAFLFTGTTLAAEGDIEISCLEKNGNIVSINATNSLPTDTLVTLTVAKEGESEDVPDVIWHYDQKKITAGKTAEFGFIISDERDDVSGTGKYIITVQNLERDKDTEVLYYATDDDVKNLTEELKKAANSVTNEDVAYEAFLSLMSEENAGAIIALGLDYMSYSAASGEVQKDTLNLFYKSDIEKMTDKEISDAFSAAFGLAIYNSGEKLEGLSLSNKKYGGKPMDEEKYKATITNMDDKYSSVSEFSDEIDIAYGLVIISEAKVGGVGDALSGFSSETGECIDIINKILKLSPTKQRTAYEYIVKAVDKINTVDELEEILEEAYDKASDSVKQSGSGSGSGGGASGSSSNRVQSGGGSVSVPQGSAVLDERVEEKEEALFVDIGKEHWAYEAVYALKKAGVVNGNENGMYEPDREITREEFTKMLVVACDINSEGCTADFIDMEENAWYTPYIGAAFDNGIINGIGDKKFGIGENITRQDMSVMAGRAVEFRKIYLEKQRDYIPFMDENTISDYAKKSVKSLYTAGVINGKGDNMFDPLGNATRAEAAKIIFEAFKGGV